METGSERPSDGEMSSAGGGGPEAAVYPLTKESVYHQSRGSAKDLALLLTQPVRRCQGNLLLATLQMGKPARKGWLV